MKKEINQNKLLLDYMRDNGHITAAVAMRELGVARLASRIHELRNSGYAIGDYFQEATNRYGDKVRYKVYFLRGNT